jgi:hypothetical protein
MDSNWSYRKDHWPHVSDHGTANVLVENTDITVNLQITAANGRPVLTVLSDNINIGKLVKNKCVFFVYWKGYQIARRCKLAL